MTAPRPLPSHDLFRACDPSTLDFTTTDSLEVLDEFVGQNRATEAVRFAIGMDREGYNLFAFGREGTGKSSLVLTFLQRNAAQQTRPDDWVYVNNFEDPRRPRALRLPPGRARVFARDMERLIEDLTAAIRAAFESEEYRTRRQNLEDETKEHHERSLEGLQKRAAEHNVAVIRTPMGLAVAPTRNEAVIPTEEFERLPQEERDQYKEAIDEIQTELASALRQLPIWQRQHRDQLKALDQEVTESVAGHLIAELAGRYDDLPDVRAHLEAAHRDVIKNATDFRTDEAAKPQGVPGLPAALSGARREPSRRYDVNIIVGYAEDHEDATTSHRADPEHAPVVEEESPTQPNLAGRIEHQSQMGALVTDFTMIKPGALHRANGGYLVLDARKLLTQPYAYDALKRALLSGTIRLENPYSAAGLNSTTTLDPEPIPLHVKVVLLGESSLYYLLNQQDPEFRKLFKVGADFDDQMDRSDANVGLYARMVATLGKRENIRPLDAPAVARVIEHGARLTGDSEKLSTHMSSVADLVREADYWAGIEDASTVSRAHVQRALDAQIYRSDRLRERIQEEIERGTIVIDCDGARVGEVNGLAVYQLDDLAFGKPSRISCRVHLGRGEVIDIEREVQLGGPLHSKGVLILSSLLNSRFGGDTPLALAASLVFEQSYGGVDGDSASSTELYALLSAISEIPIKQGLAVTGSVDQHGRIQAIGGVNEKVEGFFDICRARGLTGDQGVLIPSANVKHLMLREDVLAAAREGSFHVYSVETIDEGIELLTGVPAGVRGDDDEYPLGTVNRAVMARLRMAARRTHTTAREEHTVHVYEGGEP